MYMKFLKPLRVIVSLLFFFFTLFVFVDFAALLSAKVIGSLLYLQFIPSGLKFFGTISPASAGIIFILILTLLFGRVYCSTVCPLGTLQDFVIGVRTRIKRRIIFKFREPKNVIRYSVLVLVLLPLAFHSIFFLNLLDPYSISGKIFTNLFRPVYIGGNNLLARMLHFLDNYSMYLVPVKIISWGSFVFSGLIFLTIIVLPLFTNRWYCNIVCPVGTFLGLISGISLFKLRINQSECNSCGLCERVCKADCIDFREKQINFNICIACFNCIKTCPHHGIGYGFRFKERNLSKRLIETSDSRRLFLKSAVAGTFGITGLFTVKNAQASN